MSNRDEYGTRSKGASPGDDVSRRLSSKVVGLSLAAVCVSIAVVQSPMAATPASASVVAVKTGRVGSSGAAALGSTAYAYPSGAVFVSPTGSNSNSGSLSQPLLTVTAAMAKAPTGGTVVLRGGSYHQTFTVDKRLTIQNYPGEAVWFDGSSRVSAFAPSGSKWVLPGWSTKFDSSPSYTFGSSGTSASHWGFVDPAFPMAAHPDQVWINGVAQAQVQTVDQVSAGKFYVDYGTQRLYLGSDPGGKEVRASTLSRAIEIRAAGTVLRGVGVRRYAPSIPHMGTITAERSGISIEQVQVTDNATTGLSVLASGVSVSRFTSSRNGMLGIHGNNADNLRLTNVLASDNNTEKFNQAPVSGGLKISRTRGIQIVKSSFDNNRGTAVWLDESTYDSKIIGSTMQNNTGHGLAVEISGKTLISNNFIANNVGAGMKINNVNGARVWNNTLVDNGRPINIVQDARRASNLSTPGHDKRQPLPDPTVTWIMGPVEVRNNVISGTSANCLLCVEDYSATYSASAMRVTALGNIYQRDSLTRPSWVVIWSRGATNASVYTSLSAFKAGTGQEQQSVALDGTEAVDGQGHLTAVAAQKVSTVAQPMPEDAAALSGLTTGTRQLGVNW